MNHQEPEIEYDPAYLNSLRELYVMITIGLSSLIWTIGYCSLFGYQNSENNAPITTVAGVPSWIMWGILIPWVVSGTLTICFALFYIKDDDADLLSAEPSAESSSVTSPATSESPSK